MTLTFGLGTLDLEGDTGSATVSGTATFGAGSSLSLTATGTEVTAALFDHDNTWLASLPKATSIVYQHQLSGVGSLTLRLPLGDATTALATPKRILKVYWRGRPRMAARIDSSTVDMAVDGTKWREFSNLPGILNMVGDAAVYPEAGLSHASSGDRWFGYMSKPGEWLSTGNWSKAQGIAWSKPQRKKGIPQGLSYPNPWWIAKRGPDTIEPAGEVQYFRRVFKTTTDSISYQILATADDFLTLWLDGEQLYATDSQDPFQFRTLQQITGFLPAGTHVLAAKVQNMKWYGTNVMGLILTLQQLQSNGDVVLGTPIVNTSSRWDVADNHPGFRRADVLLTVMREAAARNVRAFQVMKIGFNHSRDSLGHAWSDLPKEYSLPAMASVLDAVQQMTEKDLDLDVDFDTLTINAYNRLGSDMFSTVKLELGGIDEDGNHVGSLMTHRVERVEAKFNTALVQLADGTYAEKADTASVSEYGRIEVGLQLGSTSDTDTAGEVAAGAFADSADTQYSVTSQLSSLVGPQVYRDFSLGDSIGVPDDSGSGYLKVRLMSVTVDASQDTVKVTPEFAVDRT